MWRSREFIARAGLEAVIRVDVGAAADTLAGLSPGEPFDAVFIDADKEGYPVYLDHALRLLRPGGLVIADNAFWKGRVLDEDPEQESTRAVRAVNRRLAEDPALLGTIIPIRDGMAVAVYSPAS